MRKRILLVDDVAGTLKNIKDELASRAPEWEVFYTALGFKALEFLAQTPCDVVVTDLRLADLSGAQLAAQVMKQYPRIHRVLLADLGDLQSLLRCVGGAHQLLAKPCEAERLRLVLERAFQTDVWLPNQAVRQIVGSIPKLPSPADLYAAVVEELESTSPSLEKVCALIASDPAMTAKVLQFANSAVYGLPLDEADPTNAAKDIGMENTKGVILLSHSFSNFRELEATGFSVETLWRHSQKVGRWARWIAGSEGAGETMAQQSATAGLLHDIGKLALGANLPQQFERVLQLMRTQGRSASDAEQAVFGATHGEVGGCLLAIWGLPVPVVEAVALHHHPARFFSDIFNPLTAVHVANAFQHAENAEQTARLVDRDYLKELGLENKLSDWWRLCREEEQKENAFT
jgi:HD-like signal output (HDOD) protein/ActR/RegA family two-component response regulator